ncbi:hypothetical protein [Clostridium sp.]|jgi:hypothetical protein|uniref:hypothetical protein n=1 Tax=Clostridium sp. TaxID=1506 RepID=UPI00258B7393|nr:hypothetical protein [Clostridium sp.]MDF2504450.1 hypothetical protein [Clostridium sp.]
MGDILNEADLEAFEKIYKSAKGYHKRAAQFLNEDQCPSVVFNVASVALECYLIALCNLYGTDPLNHNYRSLMDVAEIVVDFPSTLNEEIRSLDVMFDICSLEDYHYENPKASDSDKVLLMCNEVNKLFDQKRISSIRVAFKNGK